MATTGSRILIFMVLVNLFMLIFGLQNDATMLTNPITSIGIGLNGTNTTGGGFGIGINGTTSIGNNSSTGFNIDPPDANDLLTLFGLTGLVFAFIIGASFLVTKDIGASLRIAFGVFLTGLTLNTMYMFTQIAELPSEVKLLCGVILFVMWLVALAEYIGGVDV